MKYIRKQKEITTFGKINPSEVFEHCGNIYLKITVLNLVENSPRDCIFQDQKQDFTTSMGVCLETGKAIGFRENQAVKEIAYKPLEIE